MSVADMIAPLPVPLESRPEPSMFKADPLLSSILDKHEKNLLAEWVNRQLGGTSARRDPIDDAALREHATEFLAHLRHAAHSGTDDISSPHWNAMREFLATLSRSLAQQGLTPSETATFVFSLKEPVFQAIQQEVKDPQAVASAIWHASTLLDRLGLYTIEAFQKGREQVIARQQQEMLELSTPVVQLWEGILALPLIGTLDSERTQVVMENLLEEIVKTGAGMAIIDITGVPMVDTLVAQHLLKTVSAARLMGADCIISGIRPQIAQTIVHLGVELGQVTTKATLADAFSIALRRNGLAVTRAAPAQPTPGTP
jgi:rsbT co-antagonist protein RsbR